MADRVVELRSTLGEALRFRCMRGTETVGGGFEYRLEAVADDSALSIERLLGTNVGFSFKVFGGKLRHFHGRVSALRALDPVGGDARWEIVLRPWLWFLSRTADCRIFQKLSAVEIVKAIFKKYPMAELDDRLRGRYVQRDYCVQYRESDLDFVCRLLEDEGVAIWFTHERERHTLVLTDDNTAFEQVPDYMEIPFYLRGQLARRERDHIDSWTPAAAVQPGAYVHTAYDFEKPRADLVAKRVAPAQHELASGEVYTYPGVYCETDAGERIARLRLEGIAAEHRRAVGGGTAAGLIAGSRFRLKGFHRDDENAEHLVLQIEHELWDPAYRSGETAAAAEEPYRCRMQAMPAARPFRPPLTTPKPTMRGPQTAVVTGPAGEEIHTDKYGRVKVQFHWDRLGKKDENSSCWVRVSQAWAGTGFGAMVLPRIGQEVIVDFLEGDPDQPIVTGRVYNAQAMPPYGLPGGKNQSGLKSNSTKGGGGSNELMFDDTKGSEKTYFHAQKDADSVVEHDLTEYVKNNRTRTVDVDETITIHGNRTETIDRNETYTTVMNRSDTVQLNESRTVGLVQQQTVGAARNVTVGAAQAHEIGLSDNWVIGVNRSANVGANDSLDIGKNRNADIGDNDSLQVGKDQAVKVGQDGTVQIGKTLAITVGDEISIKTGKAMIIMKKDGSITIKGKDILIDASGKVDVKAGGNITMKGQKILQN